MCTHRAVYEAPIDEALTYKSNTLPLIVDFNKFRKIVLPCGYRVGRLHNTHAEEDAKVRVANRCL